MDSETYPGKGLSLPQLVFALNKELSHVMRLPPVGFDMVSQLERNISTALVSVRELKNTFAPINRVPLDVLSLIPTYLPTQRDLFRTTFVCRHWRRAFLQHAALWSQLSTRKGEDYMTTLLKRAKGSALDVFIKRDSPPNIITLLSPHTERIKSLTFPLSHWGDVLMTSQIISGPLPLLRHLTISTLELDDPHSRPNVFAAPSPLLFGGAVNLEEFVFESDLAGSLKNFVFPNLTTFKLSTPCYVKFNASFLLDFLEASPALRTVEMTINDTSLSVNMPREIVVLPNVKTFSLLVHDNDRQYDKLTAHISCPRARYTSLKQDIFDDYLDDNMTRGPELFPKANLWKTIVRQYSASPVEEITFEINDARPAAIFRYSLTFKSSDSAVIALGFELSDSGSGEEGLNLSHGEMNLEIFAQACRTIQDHPLLSHVKRLHFKDRGGIFGADYALPISDVVVGLFRSLGPLDELTLYGRDLRIDLPESGYAEGGFPPVKEFTISGVAMLDEEQYADAIVGLAKSQHELEKPFERVEVRALGIPVGMAERLRQWVSVVDCYELRS